MKVYIDVSCLLAVPYVSGIQRVVIEISCGLINRGREVVLFVDAGRDEFSAIDNQTFYDFYKLNIGCKEDIKHNYRGKYSEINQNDIFLDLDAVWNPYGRDRNWLYKILKNNRVKVVTYVYDLIALNEADTVDNELLFRYLKYINATLSLSDIVLNETNCGAEGLKEFARKMGYGEIECFSTWLGADFGQQEEKQEMIDEVISPVIDSKFVLMTGTLEVRKNHKLVLDAFDNGLFEEGYKLVFVGREDWRNEEFLNRVWNHKRYNKDIFFFNRLNDSSLDILYKKAIMLAFPSYDEGFGLPIVESLVRGTPVIAADIPVMREVGGDLAIYFEQDNVADFISVFRNKVENIDAYNQLIENLKRYRPEPWDAVVNRIEQIIF